MSGMVELYPSIKNVLLPKITELWCIVQGRRWNRKNDFLRFTHFIYNESIEIVTQLYSCCIHHACYDYSRTGHDKWFAAELMNWKWTVRGRLIRLVIKNMQCLVSYPTTSQPPKTGEWHCMHIENLAILNVDILDVVSVILCISNHFVIQRTPSLHNQKMTLLLNHMLLLSASGRLALL